MILFALPLALASAAVTGQATADSLRGYQYPDWFRDAKFGIWAHWGPQSVPGQGDWYARRIYEQGGSGYDYQVAHYGHPSKVGYKDIIPLWKAEKWDPDHLMSLYKKAGARYFVSMGVHHDNFDLWDSKFHRWNAVNMGPHRDVVGTWQAAAKKYGLKFGVSEHLGASFTWFQDSHGADKTGPYAGVPYDGNEPKNWDLYHQPAKPGDTGWYSNDPVWQAEWRQRIGDLVDTYQPDLLYSDGGIPFGNAIGYGMVAHYYALKKDVVYTCKQPSNGLWVEDFERGAMRGISPYPFQTDTSIGDWFYNVNWKFRDIKWVVHTLVDDVSKNGNLLLNVVQHPDGSLDPEVLDLLKQMADWMGTNGEGIYGTRPWVTFGEGKVRLKGGSFGEDAAYSGDDIRFTSTKKALYAFALGWPSGPALTIRSLASGPETGTVRGVKLLGYNGKLKWTEDAEGLHILLPDKPVSQVAVCFKITGKNLDQFKPAEPESLIVNPDASGKFTLHASDADLHGSGVHPEHKGDRDNLGYWDTADDFVSWKVNVTAPGVYSLSFAVACPGGKPSVDIEGGATPLRVEIPQTTDFTDYKSVEGLRIAFPKAGTYTVVVRPVAVGWHPINLSDITLTPS